MSFSCLLFVFYSFNIAALRGNNKLPFVLLIAFILSNLFIFTYGGYVCKKPHLEITVMPLNKDIHVYWEIEKIIEHDWIGLYEFAFHSYDPIQNLLWQDKVNSDTGRKGTSIIYNFDEPMDIDDKCLKYYAVYWRVFKVSPESSVHKVVVSTCLSNHPTWMEHYWELIKDRPLNRIFIPGTHDSASYEGLDHSPFSKMGKWFRSSALFTFIKHCKQEILPLVNLYALTQDQNVYDQLMFGIRYLDIRVFRVDYKYWACHGKFLMVRMERVANDIIEFVTKTKREIIIFDIHQLHSGGFKRDKDHTNFIKWLRNIFTWNGTQLWIDFIDNGWTKPLSDVVKNGGRIIITYENDRFQKEFSDFLWPGVHHYWGNKQKVGGLLKFLNTSLIPSPHLSYAAMAELTMNVKHICKNTIFHRQRGLRQKADEIAPFIYHLFRDVQVANRTNILAVDFARSMGAVRSSFLWNERFALNNGSDDNVNCDPVSTYYDVYYQNNALPIDLL